MDNELIKLRSELEELIENDAYDKNRALEISRKIDLLILNYYKQKANSSSCSND